VSFDRAFEKLLGVEGGYVNDPRDSGGATRYGITEAVARANGYTGEMNELPLDRAKDIYKRQYWDPLRLDDVSLISGAVAEEMFDTAVNMGLATGGKFLQRALGVLGSAITADGIIGPMTIDVLRRYIAKRGADEGVTVLLRAMNALQACRYIELAETREKDRAFIYGWLRTRVVI
jgi:lysozyme family protein